MGRIGFQFKDKGRIKFGSVSFLLANGVWWHLLLVLLASPSSLDEKSAGPTVRPGPSQPCLHELISSYADSSTKIAGRTKGHQVPKKANSIFGESSRGLPAVNRNRDPPLQRKNASIVLENRMFSENNYDNMTLDNAPPSSFIENRIPFRVIDSRRNRFKTKLSVLNGSYVDGRSQNPFLDGAPHRPNTLTVRTPSQKLDAINSIMSTAPSIPLFTGASDQLETTLESPPLRSRFDDKTLRLPLRRVTNRPHVHLELGPVWFASTVSTPKSTRPVVPTSLSPPLKTAHPPVAEVISETSTIRTEMPSLLFKIWSYGDDGLLQLETQKEIPRELLNGVNVKNGEVVNIDHIPLPIRKAVASAFNLKGSVIKRASGPGSLDAFHWQQLPSVLTPTAFQVPPRWSQIQSSPNQMAINYVVWSSTPPPLPPPSTPPPPPPASSLNSVMDIFQQLLQSSTKTPQQTLVQAPNPLRPFEQVTIVPQSAHENKLKDADIPANVASMALIMSKINKNLGQFQGSVNPGEHMSPQLLLPLYMYYLKSGQSALGTEMTLQKSSPTPLLHRDTEHALYSDPDYGFYPSNKHRVPAAHAPSSEYGKPHKNRFLFKTIKKKLKKKKKKRKGKKSSSYSLFNPPGNFKFNYAFGVDILGTLQRMFYTMLALNAAPILILTLLTLTPLALILIPKIIKWVSLAKFLKRYLHPSKPKTYHHWYPPRIKHHKHRPQEYHHYHPPRQHYHKGWTKYTQSWPKKTQTDWSPHGSVVDEQQWYPTGNPASDIGSLVQLTYGDPLKHRADEDDGYGFEDHAGDATTPFALYETELDTEHNRKVMEILMNSRNSTLIKLLESWELNSPSTSATLETDPDSEPRGKEVGDRRKKKRRRRHIRRRGLGRVVQIPKSTNIT